MARPIWSWKRFVSTCNTWERYPSWTCPLCSCNFHFRNPTPSCLHSMATSKSCR